MLLRNFKAWALLPRSAFYSLWKEPNSLRLAAMGFLNNHLPSEDTPQAHRPGAFAGEAKLARTPGPHRGLSAGPAAADRAVDVAQASPEPLSGSRLGASAGVPPSLPEGVDAAQSRVGGRPS